MDYILGYSCFLRNREYLEIIREENLKYSKECRDRILDVCQKEMKKLDMFLEISTEKIALILK